MKKTFLVPGLCLAIAAYAQKPDVPAAPKSPNPMDLPNMKLN